MGIIYSKCYNGVIMVPGFADDDYGVLVPGQLTEGRGPPGVPSPDA